VDPVHGPEHTPGPGDPQIVCESGNTPPPIAAHTPFQAIGIVINHAEICRIVRFEQDQPVSPDTKSAVAKAPDCFGIVFGETSMAVVHHYKIVARGLIFKKGQLHQGKDTL
jgi:hypothetical protein